MADTGTSETQSSIRDGILPRLENRRQGKTEIKSEGLGIRSIFRIAISVLATMAFLVIIGLSYMRLTKDELTRTNAAMRSEINYLCIQIGSLSDRLAAFERIANTLSLAPDSLASADPQDVKLFEDPIGNVLKGYTLEQTGTVVIAKNNVVVASDDERLPVGGNLQELLGPDAPTAVDSTLRSGEMQKIGLEGVLSGARDEEGYLLTGQQGDYVIAIIEPSSMVFHNRYSTIGSETVVTFVVLFVVFTVVDRLLIHLVARRIDSTNETLQQIVLGDLDARVKNKGSREFRSLAKGINVTVDALKDWIGEAERRIEQDLATARTIQEGSLPRALPAFPGVERVDLFAAMDPAREVGGDFYDHFKIDNHTVAFLIADVSGKGIPASLFMMAAKNEIQNRLLAGLTPVEAIAAANVHLCANNDAGMFVTVWAATLDWTTGELTYVNAGHNFPLLRHGQGGEWEWLTKKCGLFAAALHRRRQRGVQRGR